MHIYLVASQPRQQWQRLFISSMTNYFLHPQHTYIHTHTSKPYAHTMLSVWRQSLRLCSVAISPPARLKGTVNTMQWHSKQKNKRLTPRPFFILHFTSIKESGDSCQYSHSLVNAKPRFCVWFRTGMGYNFFFCILDLLPWKIFTF
jgi:hypothetical protein